MTGSSATPHLRVRAATGRDAKFVSELAGQVFGYLGPSYAEWSLEWMQDSRVGTLVAVRGRARVGYVMIATALSASGQRMLGNVLAIAVVPEARREGIGRTLLQAAIDVMAAADNGTRERRLDLTVAEGNAPARALFEQFGFERRDGGAAIYPAGQVSCTMSRMVAPRPPRR